MQNIDSSLAFTALLNGMPGFAEMNARKGEALTGELVFAWRNRMTQGITFADFSARWIREHS